MKFLFHPAVLPFSRRVNVSLAGVLLADTTDPVPLLETNLPARHRIPCRGCANNDWDAPKRFGR